MQIEAPWSILLIEVTLLLTLICLIGGLGAFMCRRKEKQAVKQLVAAINEEKEIRRDEIRSLLAAKYGYDGEPLEEKARALGREERRLYQTLINTYLKRDSRAIVSLHEIVSDTIDSYHELEPLAPQASVAPPPKIEAPVAEPAMEEAEMPIPPLEPEEAMEPSTDAAVDSNELRQLREENERLSEELQVTMGTISRMLSEYASMFNTKGGEGDSDDLMGMLDD